MGGYLDGAGLDGPRDPSEDLRHPKLMPREPGRARDHDYAPSYEEKHVFLNVLVKSGFHLFGCTACTFKRTNFWDRAWIFGIGPIVASQATMWPSHSATLWESYSQGVWGWVARVKSEASPCHMHSHVPKNATLPLWEDNCIGRFANMGLKRSRLFCIVTKQHRGD